MAHLEDRGADRPSRWRVRWRDAGRWRSRSFVRKADALRFQHDLEARLDAGTWIDPRRGRTTVGELAEPYLARIDATRKPTTAHSYREVWTTLVSPRWEGVPVASIRWTEVGGWIADLTGRGLSPSRVRHAHGLLKRLLDDATHDGLIAANPAVGVHLPTLPPHGDHPTVTFGQLLALADAAGRDRVLVLVLGFCGLRWSEVVGLRVGDVDRLRWRLRVAHTITEPGGRQVHGVPKTHATRWVPIPERLRADLEDLAGDRDHAQPLFTSSTGGPIRYATFRRGSWARATRATRLDRLTPHGLRHASAYLAHEVGADYRDVQAMLGHAKATTTLDVYQALFRPDLDDLAARLDRGASAAEPWRPRHATAPDPDEGTEGRDARG